MSSATMNRVALRTQAGLQMCSDRSHPDLVALDELKLTYPGFEKDRRAAEEAFFGQSETTKRMGFAAAIRRIKVKQRAHELSTNMTKIHRSHPHLAELDALKVTYPGFEKDCEAAEKAHIERKYSDFSEQLKNIKVKQLIHDSDRSHYHLKCLDSLYLTYPGWKADFRRVERYHFEHAFFGQSDNEFFNKLDGLKRRQQIFLRSRKHRTKVAIQKADELIQSNEQLKSLKKQPRFFLIEDEQKDKLLEQRECASFKSFEEARDIHFVKSDEYSTTCNSSRIKPPRRKSALGSPVRPSPYAVIKEDPPSLSNPPSLTEQSRLSIDPQDLKAHWPVRSRQEPVGRLPEPSTTEDPNGLSSDLPDATPAEPEADILLVVHPLRPERLEPPAEESRMEHFGMRGCGRHDRVAPVASPMFGEDGVEIFFLPALDETTIAPSQSTLDNGSVDNATHVLQYAAPEDSNDNVKESVDVGSVMGTDQKAKSKQFGLCSICESHTKSHVFIPCGHLCACKTCAGEVISRSMACPVCRSQATESLQVFL